MHIDNADRGAWHRLNTFLIQVLLASNGTFLFTSSGPSLLEALLPYSFDATMPKHKPLVFDLVSSPLWVRFWHTSSVFFMSFVSACAPETFPYPLSS